MKKELIGVASLLALTVFVSLARADNETIVNQGTPGKRGPWPVTAGGAVATDGGNAGIATYPVQCRATVQDGGTAHQIVQMGVNAQQVPNYPAAGRVYVNVCNSLQNTSTILIKCRADGTAPVYAAGTTGAGDVLAAGDCVLYTAPSAANTIQCISNIDAGNYVTTYECVP